MLVVSLGMGPDSYDGSSGEGQEMGRLTTPGHPV